jgi:hypothetical protein
MRPSRRLVPALLLCAFAACACGDAPGAQPAKPEPAPKPAPAPAPKPSDAVIPCSLAPAAMVGELLGLPDLELGSENVTDKVTVCEYKTPADKRVSIRFERGYPPARFDSGRAMFTNPIDVAGIGDRAFTSAFPSLGPNTPHGINSIAVLERTTHLSITAPMPLEKVTLLARELVPKL